MAQIDDFTMTVYLRYGLGIFIPVSATSRRERFGHKLLSRFRRACLTKSKPHPKLS
jgi:hypothetical protein